MVAKNKGTLRISRTLRPPIKRTLVLTMLITETKCAGLLLITPNVIADERGFFMELYRHDAFTAHGIPTDFFQQNHSRSTEGILRGLHFQYNPPLGKLIRVIRGTAFTVAVDIRTNSATFGQWVSQELSEENKQQVYVPPGFATGFCVIGKEAEVEYHYSVPYNPAGEGVIQWNDPRLAISWPIKTPLLSTRDQTAQTFDEWLARPEAKLF
jgi:dTDP-4-dehydrorhamnose 3,5-epimerase